jgi:hypothetical protein
MAAGSLPDGAFEPFYTPVPMLRHGVPPWWLVWGLPAAWVGAIATLSTEPARAATGRAPSRRAAGGCGR